MNGTKDQQKMAQEAIDRWWWPSLMMFGPHDSDSPRSSKAMKWKIKRETNDDLRQQFIDKTIPQAELIGLKVPDKNYELLENGSYKTSDIKWDEFWNVIKGNGASNTKRLKHHKAAHNEGRWVREAAIAYNKKKESSHFSRNTSCRARE